MSVASIASLRQRLSEGRRIFDRRMQNPNANGQQSQHLTVPVNQNEIMPESLASKVGDTQLQVINCSFYCMPMEPG